MDASSDAFTLVGAGYRTHRPAVRKKTLRERLKGKPVLALAVFSVIALGCLFSGLIINHDPTELFLMNVNEAPNATFWFGTDSLGRDIYSIIWYGGRASIFIGLMSAAVITVIGVAYGETVWYVYNYLNPCQRHDSQFVTLHGVLEHETNRLDGSWLVPRIAKAFGGKSYTINCKGLQSSREDVLRSLSEPDVCRVFEQFPKITVSISGVGLVDVHARQETVLLRGNFMSPDAKRAVQESDACCDLMLRFLNSHGQECDTPMRSRVVGIPLESYRRIPNKIIVAAGAEKWPAVLALLRGRLVDTLIVDQNLARKVYQADPAQGESER